MVEGIIVRGYSGFYYVQNGGREWECSLRGRYRIKSQDFLVGDRVVIEPLCEGRGVIEKVLPRKTRLQRPPIANVEQVVVVMALTSPEPDLILLDRLLVLAGVEGIKPVICLNKVDLVSREVAESYSAIYRNIYPVVITSVKEGTGIQSLKEILQGTLSVLAGPSGVGKSSLLNKIQPGLSLQTGAIGAKSQRGRHTTRYVQLLQVQGLGYVADTPGFSRLNLPPLVREDLSGYFPEMSVFATHCRFSTCLHDSEPDCAVKSAVREGTINEGRYRNYLDLLQEVIKKERSY